MESETSVRRLRRREKQLAANSKKQYDQVRSFHEFAFTSSEDGLLEQVTRARRIIKLAYDNDTVPASQKAIISLVCTALDRTDKKSEFINKIKKNVLTLSTLDKKSISKLKTILIKNVS